MEQTNNNPGASQMYDETLTSFTDSTITLDIQFWQVLDTQVNSYNSDGSVLCNLSDPATSECQISYTIYFSSVNGTAAIFATGSATF